MQNLLELKNISKIFEEDKNRRVVAVNNVNLSIHKGEVLGLVGESGCGKSTLGQIIVKLLSQTSGKIIFDNQDISQINNKNLKEFRRRAQIIFQDPYSSIDPKKTIGWLVEEPLIIHKICKNKEERKKLIIETLQAVGLDESYILRMPHELSGGQRQRVAIAIALILQPELVVCDEPVSALDVSVQAQILNLCKDLQRKFNFTYLFISHDLNVVSYLSDRIGVMYLGSIVELGTAQELQNQPLHPYTQALFSASLEVGEKAAKRIVLKGDIPSPVNPPSGCAFHTRCPFCAEVCKYAKPELKTMINGRMCACHFAEKFDKEGIYSFAT